jgi:hypothetical protein
MALADSVQVKNYHSWSVSEWSEFVVCFNPETAFPCDISLWYFYIISQVHNAL